MTLATLALALLAGSAAAAPAPGGASKGLRIETRDGCFNPAAFERLLSEGAEAWGVEENEAQRSVDLLAATIQCRAAVAHDEKACASLGMISHFPAAKLLEKDCRSEYNVLETYDALGKKDAKRAEAACARWYELNKNMFFKQLKGAELCSKAVPLLLNEPRKACERLGEQLSAVVGGGEERRQLVALCDAVWTPSRATCAKASGLPMEKPACEAYGKIRSAQALNDPKDCPASNRYGGLCRALIAKDPLKGCEAVRAEWQRLLCASRFSEGQGGD